MDNSNNLVASGYLLIERPGEYGFFSRGDWDRDALAINGEWIQKFGTPQSNITRVTLSPGLVPIQIVNYVGTGRVETKWIPPGRRELSPIPSELLFHNPAERPRKSPPNQYRLLHLQNRRPPLALTIRPASRAPQMRCRLVSGSRFR